MRSYNNYLRDPRVFCYMSYDVKTRLLNFVMISKDCDMIDNENDLTFYKWINDIGNIISEKVEYFDNYKRVTIVASDTILKVDNDVTIIKVLNSELYKEYHDVIVNVCNYNVDSITIEDNDKLNSENTGFSTDENVEELDRTLVWNWELCNVDFDIYRADTQENKAPLNLTITADKNIILLIKSSKFEKDNIFFSELVRR